MAFAAINFQRGAEEQNEERQFEQAQQMLAERDAKAKALLNFGTHVKKKESKLQVTVHIMPLVLQSQIIVFVLDALCFPSCRDSLCVRAFLEQVWGMTCDI
ncbi:hypothetical protein CYMTET_13582 [Cymbomonas tetramitiformis]|uniref:Uncharacterized protein n=1 Tax=Cymbomonas tetramitiformis TaxID=36881 RepID=A0AAE0GI40_9CHLO|nr:hypothetical protein CYMTET_13582 [Cymbomonas tetramitiformis]